MSGGEYGYRLDNEEGTVVLWAKKAPPPWDGEIWEGTVKTFPTSNPRRPALNIFFPDQKVGDTADIELSQQASAAAGRPLRVKHDGSSLTCLVTGRGFRDGVQNPNGTSRTTAAENGIWIDRRSPYMRAEAKRQLVEQFGDDVAAKLFKIILD